MGERSARYCSAAHALLQKEELLDREMSLIMSYCCQCAKSCISISAGLLPQHSSGCNSSWFSAAPFKCRVERNPSSPEVSNDCRPRPFDGDRSRASDSMMYERRMQLQLSDSAPPTGLGENMFLQCIFHIFPLLVHFKTHCITYSLQRSCARVINL